MQASWDFVNAEQRDGVRFSFGVWPTSNLDVRKLVAPLGCLYSPMKRIENMPGALTYEPIKCQCGAVLNPHVAVDYRNKVWTCNFCTYRNAFPKHYADNITEQSLPAELIPQFTTVEYELQGQMPAASGPAAFLFVVDTCCDESELTSLKDSLEKALTTMPPDALVGLITFGTLIHVFELGFYDCSKSFAFRGDKEHSTAKVQDMLNIMPTRNGVAGGSIPVQGRTSGLDRFLIPVERALYSFTQILKDLQKDPWPTADGERAQRCTGSALTVAMGLLESCVPMQGARLMMLVSGPPTVGPGVIVSRKKSDSIRHHVEIQKGQAPLMKPAFDFYNGLSDRAIANFIVVDLFACSLDQVGTLEMAPLVKKTGGHFVLADKFGQSVFKESLQRLFEQHTGQAGGLGMGFGARIDLLTSHEIKIRGALGPCASLKKAGGPNSNVSESEIGVSGTSAWYLGGIDPSTTISFFFDINPKNATPMPSHKRRHMQFLTTYLAPNGRQRLRVTSLVGVWHGTTELGQDNTAALVRSFDQEAAAVLTTRLAMHRCETESVEDVVRFLDKDLIKICHIFATYKKNEEASFKLPAEFWYYPAYMYHLRRSKFLQTANISPDEQVVCRHIFCRETTASAIIMLQPTLYSYSLSGPPQQVKLDSTAIQKDTILLLDSFSHVVVCHGETISAWKAHGYQNQEQHINFKNLLEAPLRDAQELMRNRFPFPRFIVCDQGRSEARFLLAILNPVNTHHNLDERGGGPQVLFTDDVSLEKFTKELIKLAVRDN